MSTKEKMNQFVTKVIINYKNKTHLINKFK